MRRYIFLISMMMLSFSVSSFAKDNKKDELQALKDSIGRLNARIVRLQDEVSQQDKMITGLLRDTVVLKTNEKTLLGLLRQKDQELRTMDIQMKTVLSSDSTDFYKYRFANARLGYKYKPEYMASSMLLFSSIKSGKLKQEKKGAYDLMKNYGDYYNDFLIVLETIQKSDLRRNKFSDQGGDFKSWALKQLNNSLYKKRNVQQGFSVPYLDEMFVFAKEIIEHHTEQKPANLQPIITLLKM